MRMTTSVLVTIKGTIWWCDNNSNHDNDCDDKKYIANGNDNVDDDHDDDDDDNDGGDDDGDDDDRRIAHERGGKESSVKPAAELDGGRKTSTPKNTNIKYWQILKFSMSTNIEISNQLFEIEFGKELLMCKSKTHVFQTISHSLQNTTSETTIHRKNLAKVNYIFIYKTVKGSQAPYTSLGCNHIVLRCFPVWNTLDNPLFMVI